MPAAWECLLGNLARTGCYLDPTFSSGIRGTISRKLPNAFETQTIRKRRISPHAMSCNLHQRKKRLRHLPGPNRSKKRVDSVSRIFAELRRALRPCQCLFFIRSEERRVG